MELLKYINDYINGNAPSLAIKIRDNVLFDSYLNQPILSIDDAYLNRNNVTNIDNNDYYLIANNITAATTIDTRFNSIYSIRENPLTDADIEQIRNLIREELRRAGLEE